MPPPLAVSVVLSPVQIEVVPVIEATGGGVTVTVTDVVSEQPPEETVTE